MQRAVGPGRGLRAQVRRLGLPGSQDVGHPVAGHQKIVADDLAVALRPVAFGAHDGRGPRTGEPAQGFEPGAEGWRRGVVGVVAQGRLAPGGIRRGRGVPRGPALAAQGLQCA